MKSRINPGDIVRIVFHDHAAGAGIEKGVLTFECFGRISSIESTHYNLCTWGYVPESLSESDSNCEYLHIVKNAVISITRLK